MREQGMFDPARLVFVDETAANTKMVRLSGRCPRGERLIGRVPQGHWKTITFVAALRRNGMRAPCTVDGSMSGSKFLAYVQQCLAPTLKRKDIVVIDNLLRRARWVKRVLGLVGSFYLFNSRVRRSAQYKVAAKMANAVTTPTNHMRSRGMGLLQLHSKLSRAGLLEYRDSLPDQKGLLFPGLTRVEARWGNID